MSDMVDVQQMDTTTKEGVAFVIGEEVSRIGTVRFQLDTLLKEGILIDLSISGESLFLRQADWADFGFTADDIRASRLTRGQKYLIPEDQVKRVRSITTRMRQALESLTRDITGFRPYRYLNYRAYPAWKDRWSSLLAEFLIAKAEILSNYDTYRAALENDFTEIARQSWASIVAAGYRAAIVGRAAYAYEDDFIAGVVRSAMDKFPSRYQIESGLNADYRVSIIEGIDLESINTSRETAKLLNRKAQEELSITEMEKSRAFEQMRHESAMFQKEEMERDVKIEAMLQAEAEHIREQYKETVFPMEEVFMSVRQECADAAIEMLESIKKNGRVHGRVAERAKNMIDLFELIRIADDRQLRDRLVELKSAIGAVGDDRTKDSPERSTADVVTALEAIRGMVSTAKEDMLAGDSRFAMID